MTDGGPEGRGDLGLGRGGAQQQRTTAETVLEVKSTLTKRMVRGKGEDSGPGRGECCRGDAEAASRG